MLRLLAYVVLGATLVALAFGVAAMRPRLPAAPDPKQAIVNAGPVDEPVGDGRQSASEGRDASGAAVGEPAPGPASPRESSVPWAPPTDEPALEQVVLPRDASTFGGAVERVPSEPAHVGGGLSELDTSALLQSYLEALRILEMD